MIIIQRIIQLLRLISNTRSTLPTTWNVWNYFLLTQSPGLAEGDFPILRLIEIRESVLKPSKLIWFSNVKDNVIHSSFSSYLAWIHAESLSGKKLLRLSLWRDLLFLYFEFRLLLIWDFIGNVEFYRLGIIVIELTRRKLFLQFNVSYFVVCLV